MAKPKPPVTQATRALQLAAVPYTCHLYPYEERGGTAVCARELAVDEHIVIKTLVMQDEEKHPFIVLMHGDCETSLKALARQLNVKTVAPCDPAVALKHTGYQVGGTSPFGMLKPLPVYIESTIAQLPEIYINGGKRGFILCMKSSDLISVLNPTAVTVAIKPER